MIVATMLGLVPFTPPNGMPKQYVQDMGPSFPQKAPPVNQSALNEKEAARKRYYAGFKALGFRATPTDLADEMEIERSTAQKWLSKHKGVLVRHCGKHDYNLTNKQIIWEWIRDDD